MPVRRPSICFVSLSAFPLLAGDTETEIIGGAELQQVFVAKRLVERGYLVSMVCLDFGQDNQVVLDGVKVFRAYRIDEGVPILRFLWPRLTSIWRCLRAADADIYYQRTAGMLTGVVAAFCRRNAKMSIFAAAGNPDLEPNTPRIRYARDRRIYEYGLRNVDRILVQNEEQKRLCKVNYGRSSTVVPNCYPLPTSAMADNGRFVLWVSTIRSIKQPQLFVDLAESLPNHSFRMIGGPDSDERLLYDQVKSRADSVPNLEFLGFIPYQDIHKYFDEASVFVNTSSSEGFPNTFLQAWSRGIPTVSFIDSGARLEGRPVGRQVGSSVEMSSCVANWLTDDLARARKGSRCREYFMAVHSPSRVLDMYDRVFSQMSCSNPS